MSNVMHARHRHAPLRKSWLDRIGATGALVCALHCALVPVLIAVLPALGITLLLSPDFEFGFVLFATLFGLAVLAWSYRRHRTMRALALLVPGLLLFILSVVGIGLMISAVSATQQQAILGAFAIGVPSVLMSGFATPVENMPTLLQWLAQAIPLTHFLIIVEGSFLKAMSPGDILASLWPLALIALVSLTMAIIFVRGRLQ